MNTEQKSRIIAILGDASLFLSIFAGLPYAFGDVADAFGPEVKKWVAVSALFLAAMSKAVQRAVEIMSRSTSNPGSPLGSPDVPLPVVVTNTTTDPVQTEKAREHVTPPPNYRGPIIP